MGDVPPIEPPSPRQPVRTFHARHGRFDPRSAETLDRLWPRFGVAIDGRPLQFEALFGTAIPVVLELGFGMGEATVQLAQRDPGTAILAVEVHTPGIVTLLRRCERDRISNIRVAHGDAITLLTEMIAPASLAGVRAFFPDPWPKTRHHKRRLVRPDLVSLISDRLAPGGLLHVSTDWFDYARQMLEVLEREPMLTNEYPGFAPRPSWRPVTRYERLGLAKGHQITDLMFRRVTAPATATREDAPAVSGTNSRPLRTPHSDGA